jgi:hypothetical protein
MGTGIKPKWLWVVFIIHLAASEKCFTQAEVDELVPNGVSDRMINGELPELLIFQLNWQTAQLASQIPKIIAGELLGYNATYSPESGGSEFSWYSIANGTADYVIENWDYGIAEKFTFTVETQKAMVYGENMYQGSDGMFYNLPEEGKALFNKKMREEIVWSYLDENVAKYLSKFPSIEQMIADDPQFKKKMRDSCSNADFDTSKPVHVFDPWNCYGTDKCFEWIVPTTTWNVNLAEQIIRNLELPVYLTHWNGADDSCEEWFGQYFTIVNHLFEKNLPMFYYWYAPDGSIPMENFLLFSATNPECETTTRSDNIEGYGGRECWSGKTALIKIGTPRLVNEDIYRDAGQFLAKYDPSLAVINDLLERAKTSNSDLETGCQWLKDNPSEVERWLTGLNLFALPIEAEEGNDLTVIFLTSFGGFVVVVILIALMNHFGIIDVISTAVASDFFSVIISLAWKCVDFSMTAVGLWEVTTFTDGDIYPLIYCIFTGVHCLCFGYAFYVLWNDLQHLNNNPMLKEITNTGDIRLTNTNTDEVLTAKQSVQYNLKRNELHAANAFSGCISFMFEDIFGSILNLYGLWEFEDAAGSILFIIVTALQVFETGLSFASFQEYGYALRQIDVLEQQISYMQSLIQE